MVLRIVALLLGPPFVDHPLGGGRNYAAGAVLAAVRAGDGIQAHLVRLASFVDTGGENTECLAYQASSFQRRTADVDGRMPDEAGRLALHAGVVGDDVSDDGLGDARKSHRDGRQGRMVRVGVLAHGGPS